MMHSGKLTKIVSTVGPSCEDPEVLKQMIEQEAEEQEFKAQQGDVDTRDDHLKSEKLSEGYHNFCGFKGEKLSGGQK